jgi:hypothetical protein
MAAANYDWDDLEDNIVEEYDDVGNSIADYTTEPHRGNVISQRRGSECTVYHFDALASTLALSDISQHVTDVYAYSVYGEHTERIGTTTNSYQFMASSQYYRDGDSNEYMVGGNRYSATSGRWLTNARPGLPRAGNAFTPYRTSAASGFQQTEGDSESGRITRRRRPPTLKELGKCVWGIECLTVVTGALHCGIYLYFDLGDKMPLEWHHLHAYGRLHNPGKHGCTVEDTPEGPPIGWWWARPSRSSYHWADEEVCRCMLRTRERINAHVEAEASVTYALLPSVEYCGFTQQCNSNYVTKCILAHCGVGAQASGDIAEYYFSMPGWGHRMWQCERGRIDPEPVAYDDPYNRKLCCCDKWKLIDTAWCGTVDADQSAPT